MTVEVVNEEAMAYALARIKDFATVQEGREWSDQLEAVGILLDSLGLTEGLKEDLNGWLEEFLGETSGEVMLGLLIGLFVIQYNEEA